MKRGKWVKDSEKLPPEYQPGIASPIPLHPHLEAARGSGANAALDSVLRGRSEPPRGAEPRGAGESECGVILGTRVRPGLQPLTRGRQAPAQRARASPRPGGASPFRPPTAADRRAPEPLCTPRPGRGGFCPSRWPRGELRPNATCVSRGRPRGSLARPAPPEVRDWLRGRAAPTPGRCRGRWP